jgi:Na+/H+-dicarboxylate symporter
MDTRKKRKSLFEKYIQFPLIYKILLGLVFGVAAGIFFGPGIKSVEPIGEIFLRLLKMVVMPLILFTLIVGASNLNPKKLGKIGGEIVLFYLATSFIVCFIGVISAFAFAPGVSSKLQGWEYQPAEIPSFLDTVLIWIPENPFRALTQFPASEENGTGVSGVLPTIIFALLFGVGLTYLRNSEDLNQKKAGETLYNVSNGCAEIMYKIVRAVLEFAPFGVFALIAVVIGESGIELFIDYGKVIGASAVATLAVIFGVYPFLLSLSKLSPLNFFTGAKEAMLTAFVTRSSSGTLPVSMRNAEENLKIDRNLCSFALPIGATINMHGTSIYLVVSTIFAANLVGKLLTPVEIVTLLVVVVAASIGVAGIPAGGLMMLAVPLGTFGLPFEVIGLIAGIDVLLDMIRTSCNVTGDLVCTSIVAKREGLMIKGEKGENKK